MVDNGRQTADKIIPNGNGPIFMAALDCSSEEDSLLDCPYYSSIGITSCSHNLDAAVSCEGNT